MAGREVFRYKTGWVAGRVDDSVVALRTGSRYSLLVTLDQDHPKVPSGHYRIVARLDGQGPTMANGDMKGVVLLNFWKGALASNVVEVDVR